MRVSRPLAPGNGVTMRSASVESRERVALAAAFQHAMIGIAIGDADGQLCDVNPALTRMLGYDRDELLTFHIPDITHPDDHGDDAEQWSRMKAGEVDAYQREKRYLRKDGTVLWGLVTVSALRDDAGTFLGSSAQIQDISAQKAAEAALREREARLESLVAQLPIVLYNQPLGGQHAIGYVSPRFVQQTGLDRETIPRDLAGLLALSHPDDREQLLLLDERTRHGQEPAHAQYRLRGGNGEWAWIDHHSVLMRDEWGAPLAWHGSMIDISERKRLESSLRESERLFRHAFESAAIGMAITDQNDICLDANDAYCAILGIARAELVGRSIVDLTHPDDRPAADERRRRLRAGESDAYVVEKRYVRPDGQVVMGRLTISAVRDDAGAFLYAIGQLQDITAQKATEAALRESEALLRTVMAQAPAAVYRLEPGENGRFTFASPRFADLTGLSIDETLTTLSDYFSRVHPEDLRRLKEADAEASRTGQPFDIEYRLRGLDGSWRWVHDRSTPARNEQGRVVAWHGVVLDISERRRLEASIRESEARFRSTFESAGIGMSVVDRHGAYIDVNPAFCQLLGRSREELLRLTFVEITHPDDLATNLSLLQRLTAGEIDSYSMEKRYLHPEGRTVWADLTVSAVRGDEGTFLYEIAQIVDITARKEAEEALRESEARFRALVQNDPDVIVIVDPEMIVTYVSPAARAAFGTRPEDSLGPVDDHLHRVHPADQESVLALFNEVAARSGAVASTEARIEHVDLGWRWFQLTVTNLLDDPGIAGYLFNLRDVTERKQAELATIAALKSQQEAIDELERLNQGKSRFLSTISHEFRTPLTSIIGYSEFMKMNAANPELVAEDAAVIHREASRLNRLVDDVLLIDRVEAGHISLSIKPVDLNAVARRVAEANRPLTENHELILDLDPALPPVDGDLDRLAQALTNLVSNAVKYSPDGGAITITTRGDDGAVVVSVRDQGLGIAPHDLHRIFDRFERVETGIAGRIAGTGLGLSIVKEIVNLHGGHVWVESDPGMGSLFSFSIPASRATAPNRHDRRPGYTPPHAE